MQPGVRTALIGAMLVVSHPARSESPALPPPYLAVSTLQYMCDEKLDQSGDPASRKTAGECRGYVRAIVDRYFATEFKLKKGQILPVCDWDKATDMLIAEVRESVDGPIIYSWQSPAEPWLRKMLSQKCEDKR